MSRRVRHLNACIHQISQNDFIYSYRVKWKKNDSFLLVSDRLGEKKLSVLFGFLLKKTIEKPQLNGAAHSLNYHNFTARLNKYESNEMQHLQCISNIRLLSAANLSQTDFMFCIFLLLGSKTKPFPTKCENFWYLKCENGFKSPAQNRKKEQICRKSQPLRVQCKAEKETITSFQMKYKIMT